MRIEEQPLVSIVIPVLNGASFIRETILSILDQTHTNLELIVVNDGSTDDTLDIVKRTFDERSDKRTSLISRENRGMCCSLNEGLAQSQGKYFAYIGADDIWHAQKLELQVNELERLGPEYGGSFTDCWIIDSYGKRLSRFGEIFPYRGGDIYLDVAWMKFQPASPTVLFRRDALESVGRFNESQLWEDRDTWIRISREYKVAYINKPLASYRRHDSNGSTSDPNKMYRYAIQVLESTVLADPSLKPHEPRMRAMIDAFQSAAFYDLLQMKMARQFAFKSLRKDPTNRLAWRNLLFSLLGKDIVKILRQYRKSKSGYKSRITTDG